MTTIKPMVVDLSHWDPAYDYEAVKLDGIVGVIYKATEGQSYTDDTYVGQQQAAKAAGLKWGSYHFADGSDVVGQIDNYLRFACPDPDELFCLDWEDNPSGNGKMSVSQVKDWVNAVERALNREGQCVIYGGNTTKEMIDGDDPWFGERRLWLCQYGTTPTWQQSWDNYWLWQYTDGVYGPDPHAVAGIGPCDVNHYDHSAEQLIAEWATGMAERRPLRPDTNPVVNIIVVAPPSTTIKVRQVPNTPPHFSQKPDRRWEGDVP